VTRLKASDPLAQALRRLLAPENSHPAGGEVLVEPLPASRQVLRFTLPEGGVVVGKFFGTDPPLASADLSLAKEYDNYRHLPALGLDNGRPLVPRLLGRCPETSLGLLLEAVPGPDLDYFILNACQFGDQASLSRSLGKLARLLARFHARPVPAAPLAPDPALAYLDKVMGQLQAAGLLTREDIQGLSAERTWWESRFRDFADGPVLVHGDATPTNFLFPDGRAVALDLEKLRYGDRLWDLSWVAGELKHAWGWRTRNFAGAEGSIGDFFGAYLAALPLAPPVLARMYSLNPFYMALAELRIARNLYLTRDYRRELVAEARRCLTGGREW
jgi:Ser/Thr protein kinase RdoA (MazF antagonist)